MRPWRDRVRPPHARAPPQLAPRDDPRGPSARVSAQPRTPRAPGLLSAPHHAIRRPPRGSVSRTRSPSARVPRSAIETAIASASMRSQEAVFRMRSPISVSAASACERATGSPPWRTRAIGDQLVQQLRGEHHPRVVGGARPSARRVPRVRCAEPMNRCLSYLQLRRAGSDPVVTTDTGRYRGVLDLQGKRQFSARSRGGVCQSVV
jgi:hypothetical protein